MISSLLSVEFPDMREFVYRFAESVKREMHRILTAFSEGQLPQLFNQYFRRLEEYIIEKTKERYEIFMHWIERIFSHLERDEDFRMLKSFVLRCKGQVMKVYYKAVSNLFFLSKNFILQSVQPGLNVIIK